jgi:hypothetical protein
MPLFSRDAFRKGALIAYAPLMGRHSHVWRYEGHDGDVHRLTIVHWPFEKRIGEPDSIPSFTSDWHEIPPLEWADFLLTRTP